MPSNRKEIIIEIEDNDRLPWTHQDFLFLKKRFQEVLNEILDVKIIDIEINEVD